MKRDIWLKAHIFRQGHLLRGVVGTLDGLSGSLFEVSIDLRPIALAVYRQHQELHKQSQNPVSGCVGCNTVGFLGLGKVVRSIGRSKLVRKIGHVATSIVKSKEVGIGLGALTLAFPPVGAPALAAYASANVTLAAAERGSKVAHAMKGLVHKSKTVAKVKARARGKSRGELALAIRATPGSRQALKQAIQSKRVLRKISRSPALMKKIRRTQTDRKRAKTVLKSISANLRYSNDPKKRAQAEQAARVMALVHNARARISAIEGRKAPQAETGILITAKGPITGKFRALAQGKGTHPDLLMLANDSESGSFERVGGCIGCGLFAL